MPTSSAARSSSHARAAWYRYRNEAFSALRAGAPSSNCFPRRATARDICRRCKSVLPKHVKIFPVGGIGSQDIAEWLASGADGFGFGGELFKPAYTLAELTKRAQDLSRHCDRARKKINGAIGAAAAGGLRESGNSGHRILAIYAIGIFVLAQWVSREKARIRKTRRTISGQRSLPWWAIGTSLIAANISAEQIVGMSGSGYVMGMAIASYEWMAALTLIVVGKWILPVFLKNGIYTMPEFLERALQPGGAQRDGRVLARAVHLREPDVDPVARRAGGERHRRARHPDRDHRLALFALAYALYGGLKAVALTDIVQVSLLVLGGIIITYMSLDKVRRRGVIAVSKRLRQQFPEKFDMILSKDNPHYKDLPGLAVLLGGMWMMNVSYWGFNQYIIQRGLAAKSVNEGAEGHRARGVPQAADAGDHRAAGIAALVIVPGLEKTDQAYPSLMAMLPVGIKGPGVRGAGRGHRRVHGLQDQFDRHHLHDGPVSRREAEHSQKKL
jgi:hypothetical protein